MASEPLIRRAQVRSSMMTVSRVDRVLGHPLAFLLTTAVLIAIFGWTFFANPGRPAAADDPAYYHWRTEALLANDPQTLLEVDGPRDMYSGGYRVATPVIGGIVRRIAGVAPLTTTVIVSVGLRVLVPLLLAGFALRWRPDPLIWHAVAFTTASLLPTPPFAGYLDNVLTLAFLSASLYLIEPSRHSWPARLGFGALLLVSGFTHPTTLAIFCLTLGAMAFARLCFSGFSLRAVLRNDAPLLLAALSAVVLTYATWKLGIWGGSAPLSESAQPPPAGADFFRTRLADWLGALGLPLNGPLLLIGLVGLLAGRRFVDEALPRVTIVWLVPLLGLLGAVVGLSYPYYRFFNTTTAWLLLVAIGGYFVVRYSFDVAGRGGAGILALIGLLLIGAVIGLNFKRGFAQTGWNNVSDAWIKQDEKSSLEQLSLVLAADRYDSVVFVVDDDAPEPVRIYGFAKRSGNVSRYGVPAHLQGSTAFYLGSLENYLDGKPTARDDYYEGLSADSLADAREVVSGRTAVVVAEVFNRAGNQEDELSGNRPIDEPRPLPTGTSVLTVKDGAVLGRDEIPNTVAPSSFAFLPALLGGLLLLLPGFFFGRWALPDMGPAEALGLVPTFAATAFVLVGMGTLGITGGALTGGTAWTILAVCGIVGLLLFLWSGFRGEQVIARKDPGFSEL